MLGTTLSHYQILAELGRGGMGLVYKAKDTKLGRTVAIKILPPTTLASDDSRVRFYREARAAAKLNHRHIASVYEIDEAVPDGAPIGTQPRPFIVMEFVEGEPLSDRIRRGPLLIREAVRIAVQTAEALGVAHESEVVHRDIKAQNVMLTKKGDVKVLDFGLALTAESTKLTRMGSTLGTVAYMSPEQARGEEVDHRTDIWALGITIYEMVAGVHPFGGDYEQAVVYSILNEDPAPLTGIRTGVPRRLEWVIEKCLAKSAGRRYQSCDELIVDLKNLDLDQQSSQITAKSEASRDFQSDSFANSNSRFGRLTYFGATVMLLVLIGLLYTWWPRDSAEHDTIVTRVEIPVREMVEIRFPTMSPNGEYLAFTGSDRRGRTGLFLRKMSSGLVSYVSQSGGAISRELVFSPDSRRLAYTHESNGGVFVVEVPLGVPRRETASGRVSYWENSQTLIYVDDAPGGQTYRIRVGSQAPSPVQLDHGKLTGDYVDIWRSRLPESGYSIGHRLSRGPDVQAAISYLVRAKLTDGEMVEVVEDRIMNPLFVPGGYIVYQQENDSGPLLVRSIDPETGEFNSPPRQALLRERTTFGRFSVTDRGDLLFIPVGFRPDQQINQIFLVDLEALSATPMNLLIPAESEIEDVQYSPDGRQLVYSVTTEDEQYLAVHDLTTGASSRLIFKDRAHTPHWSPDGEYIYFTMSSDAGSAVYRTAVGSDSQPELVSQNAIGWGVSPNGELLSLSLTMPGATHDMSQNDLDLYVLNMKSGDMTAIDTTYGFDGHGEFSPDGSYLAYRHSVGSAPDVRIASLDGTRNSQVPNEWGAFPKWTPSGDRLYFAQWGEVLSIPVTTNPVLQFISEASRELTILGTSGFDVSPDGSSIAIISKDVQFQSVDIPGNSIVWVQNWSEFLSEEFSR